jgi:hypothetical protein
LGASVIVTLTVSGTGFLALAGIANAMTNPAATIRVTTVRDAFMIRPLSMLS